MTEPSRDSGDAAEGDPVSWRNAREFAEFLEAIRARLFLDSAGLVCVAPSHRFSRHVAAGLRIWVADLAKRAKRTEKDIREPAGWTWLRVGVPVVAVRESRRVG